MVVAGKLIALAAEWLCNGMVTTRSLGREKLPRAIVPTTHLRPRCYHSRIPGAYFAHAVPHAIRNVKGEKNSIQIVMTMLEHKQFDRTILRSV